MAIVRTTRIIEASFLGAGLNLLEFCDLFRDWKVAGKAGEDDFYEFGKDAPYETPQVNGRKNILMHVHLVPLIEIRKKREWDENWGRYSRRTSNKALVYVGNGRAQFLLIAILPEPMAHKICKMATPEDHDLMHSFAAIADAFIYFDKIIA